MQHTSTGREGAWDDFRLLLMVAEAGSFALAARSLGLATSTVSRRIAAWERRLGVPLMSRRRDGVRLLPAGASLLVSARRLQSEVAQAELSVAKHGPAEGGTVRISAGDGMAEALLPVLADIRQQHPQFDLELRIETAVADLGKWQVDIAIRAVRPTGEGVLARRLGGFQFGLYAARAYLERFGTPRSVADLKQHRTLGLTRDFVHQPGVRLLAQAGVDCPSFRFNSVALGVEAVHAGLGIGPVVHALAGGLQRVLPELQSDFHPLWLVRHRDTRGVRRVDAVAKALYDRLRALASR